MTPADQAGKQGSGELADGFARSTRVTEIDTAKGIGIVLVVLGHMVARDVKPLYNDWWLVWHDHLYSFHMAFFFFLSGYVFFLKPTSQWLAAVRKSAAKLLPAYFAFAVIVYAAKAMAVRVLHVDRPVRGPLAELVQMLSYPTEGFAQFLWFIVTLLMIYALMILVRSWISRYYGALIALAVFAHFLSIHGYVTDFLAMHQLARYALFFLVAAACHRHQSAWRLMVTKFGALFVGAFCLSLLLLPDAWLPTVAALLSIPALVAIAVWVNPWTAARELLQFLGRNTFTIYLMNSLAMGLVRAIILRTWGWDGWHFFAVAPLLLVAGLLLPIAIQRGVLSRWSWSDRISR